MRTKLGEYICLDRCGDGFITEDVDTGISSCPPTLRHAYTDSLLTNVAASMTGEIKLNYRLKGNGVDRAGRHRLIVSKFYIYPLIISGFTIMNLLATF
jgi:hypothetical protein